MASNTATEFTLNGSETWEQRNALRDGFGIGDTYYISKTVEDTLTDIFNDADITLSLSQNITKADQFGVTVEYKDRPIWDFVAWVIREFNCKWWVDWGTLTFHIVSVDNLVDSGVTLTHVDFFGWLKDGWAETPSTDRIPDAIRVIGADGIVVDYTVAAGDYAIEYSNTSGLETFIEEDPEIKSKAQALQRAEALSNILKNAQWKGKFILNTSDVDKQNYAAVKNGALVNILLPTALDTSIANWQAGGGNNGQVMISNVRLKQDEQSGDQVFLYCNYERVYSS